MKYLAIITICFLLSHCALADDWPHWMGPTRDNVWREDGLLDAFPEEGPPIVWRRPIAGGYAGPAVADGRVCVTDFVANDSSTEASESPSKKDNTQRGIERVWCLNEATGKIAWYHEYAVVYGISYPAGPRCTPTIDGNRVYTLGAEGNLFCFDLASGDVLWSKDFKKDYGAKTAMWGYASHPRIDGQKLICIVGGKGRHAVAFDKINGTEIWHSGTATEQGYSPPIIIKAGGARQLILMSADAIRSIDPETGGEHWSVPYKATSGSIIMSPVYAAPYLYVGGFNQKNLLLELASDRPAASIIWGDKPKHGISPVNVQPFVEDGVMYGFHQSGALYAVELPSGKRLWRSTAPLDGGRPVSSGTAFLVKQADRFWMFSERGELLIAKINRTGFEEISRTKVIEPTNRAFGRRIVWSMPAFANRRAYIRNDREIICVDLANN